MNEGIMKKHSKRSNHLQMLPEYDFSGGQRGKYAKRYQQGSNVVVLDPDVARVFSNSKAVNEALRSLNRILQHYARIDGKHAKSTI